MSDITGDDAVASGRPNSGAVLAQSMEQAAARRAKSRDLSPLAGLWPHVRAHIGDAILAGVFLISRTPHRTAPADAP